MWSLLPLFNVPVIKCQYHEYAALFFQLALFWIFRHEYIRIPYFEGEIRKFYDGQICILLLLKYKQN
jgi:hypothetical protein